VQVLCNNFNITLYLPYPYALNDAIIWIEGHKKNFEEDCSYEFAITDRKTEELYGAISLSNNQRFNNGGSPTGLVKNIGEGAMVQKLHRH